MQRFGKQSLQLHVLLIGLVCFSLNDPTSALSQVVTDTFSQTIAGDVLVYLNATYWRCDLVLCPAGTDQCVVTKSRSPTEPRDLIRRNICLSANKQQLVDESVTEPIKSNEDINFKLIVSSSGSSVLQDYSYSNTYTGTSYSSSSVNTDAVSKAAEKATADAVANAAANTAHINRQIARTLQQIGEEVRRSLDTVQQDLKETFRSAGLWRK
ncbi:uncharacterized protein LOC126761425 [Bactrocera neohumeralis]|uniref:uncharacterized protein LOC120779022 n=1 Tax=Bactrocera tryoni TaxID=59916 RepID=UPI001A9A0F6E|nr:uncharacterized protein LOC120779022 [Bactrocera tryoni]XP_039967077.1 uncharacterized protein LOC120779022 [Bactrocera tryoni]XP_039967078.1 uncharacterized protein LOC120779022 [Bactrocera tryoni]XP_050333518.1 uncharacterized protein LOC126761425 [Bactrocera neohumeralis]XP_050333519.1 uncharacterized protein LOC126761425 [Bactrocera neohumeralis]XP_050333521.1 uncharacterized protein LOC126761425 [Bactrocera neohumeralis]